ncbi:MAG: radical SAM protein, partial [Planctomycetota bacterium]
GGDREAILGRLAGMPHVYIPRFYEPQSDGAGRQTTPRPVRGGVPELIEPAVVADFDAMPVPTRPVVPYVECVQDRIVVEIMRGCPGRCRFCQSTTLKRPVRFRKVETIVRAALEAYYNTGLNEVSLLSLSSSDYPNFNELLARLQETLRPLGVSISLPSLRVNEQWRTLADMIGTERHSGLTLAPEVARDDMRKQIGKRITNDDLYEGCRNAFANGFSRVKLYFMCGLPGEREADLDGIIEMAETISRLGKEIRGRPATVVANVSNFVPKPQTPYQFNAMQRAEYFRRAREYLYQAKRMRSVQLRCHDVESSMIEGLICRGDRRFADVIELAWRAGARFDAWSEKFRPELWKEAVEKAGIDVDRILHQPLPIDARLPWDHIAIRQGRKYLEREYRESVAQRSEM